MAKANVDQMLRLCSKTIPADEATDVILEAQRKSLHEAVHELVKQITSPNQLVREQVVYSHYTFLKAGVEFCVSKVGHSVFL